MTPRTPRLLLSCGLLLACAPSPTAAAVGQSAPGAAPAPQQAPAVAAREPLLDAAAVQAVYEEAVTALREGAQIDLRAPVPALLLTAEEARVRRAAFSKTLPDGAGVTAAMDLAADFVFSESMLGRYLPDEKVLYIIEDVLLSISGGDREEAVEQLFGIMAHELVHAHDDQVYGVMPTPDVLMEVAADGRKLVEIQTRMSLLEGHAVYAAELACAHAGRKPLQAITEEQARRARVLPSGDDPLSRIGSGFVNSIARTKLMQYVQGRAFCMAAYRFGGEKFLGEVFRSLPLTPQELESFEGFKQRWALEQEEAQDAAAAADGPSGS